LSYHQKSGLSWSQAEITDLQGIVSLSFQEPATPSIAIELVISLSEVAGLITPEDIVILGPSGETVPFDVLPFSTTDKEIHLTFAERGPRGKCIVELKSNENVEVHPFFGESSFDFYIDCPKDDCRPVKDLRPDPSHASPSLDFTTKDFRGFLSVAQNWVKSTDPNWSDLSTASTEKMFLELMAHHGEMLSLLQDRTFQESSPETARERISIRKHAEFLGLKLTLGNTSKSIATIDLSPGKFGFLPHGSQAIRRTKNNDVSLYFHTHETTLLDSRWNAGLEDTADAGNLKIAAWPDAIDATIPIGTKNLYLLNWDLGLSPGQRIFLLQEQNVHICTLNSIEEIVAKGWVTDPSLPLTTNDQKITAITWSEATESEFQPWVDPVEYPFRLGGNLVDIEHGRLRKATNLGDEQSIPLSSQRQDAVFSKDQITNSYLLRAIRTPESNILVNANTPSVQLKIGSKEWIQQDSLWNSSSFDPHFTTEVDNDGSVWLVFGDGIRGAAIECGSDPKIPSFDPANPETLIELSFYQGNAEEGNIGAFALSDMLPPQFQTELEEEFKDLSVIAATNIVPGTGGERIFDIENARDLIPESIAHPQLERCVTNQDYAIAAMQLDDIVMAVAKPLGGIFNTIALLCAPKNGYFLTPEQTDSVFYHIDNLRMTGREHIVQNPNYVPLDIGLLICPKTGVQSENLKESIRQALIPNFNEKPGFFHHSRFGFGAKITASTLLAAVAKVPGVGAVKLLTFKPLRENSTTDVYDIIELGPTEIPMFAGQIQHPELGRLTVRIEGLDPPALSSPFIVGGPALETTFGGSL